MYKLKGMLSMSIIIILVVAMFAACGSKKVGSSSKDFEFTYKDETVTIDSEAAKLLEKAGKAVDTKKTESCAFQGYDRTYVYDDFTIKTYSKSKTGEEYVNSIDLKTDKVATKEDIKIGSTKKDLEKAYGTVKDKFGVYTYTKGKTKLVIEVDDSDKVISIQYMKN